MKLKRNDISKYVLILSMILLVSLLHYKTSTEYRYLHEIYQRVYYIPILLAAFWYGPLLGIITATFTSILYVFHIHRDWTHLPVYSFDQYVEIILYHILALVIGFLSLKERRYRQKQEKTAHELSDAYQKLQNTFEQLKKADRLAALGRLSSGIAHEIRNPLGSIKGSIEILEGEIQPDNPKYEFMKIIKDEVTRLNSIVSEFLKFARPPKPTLKPTSINELVDSTLILLRQQARESKVEINRQLDPDLPLINLDGDQIRQVFLNLVLNGTEAMANGGRLDIKSRMGNKDRYIAIEFSDTGPGLSEEDLEHIFDPFFTTKEHGTGLGLSISYQLVQNHKGTITAYKNENKGLTFRVELPLDIANMSD